MIRLPLVCHERIRGNISALDQQNPRLLRICQRLLIDSCDPGNLLQHFILWRQETDSQPVIPDGKLLKLLIANEGNAVPRDLLVDRIWTDGAEYVDENALSVTVKRLRAKLEDKPQKPQFIRTVYGIGYRWEAGEHE